MARVLVRTGVLPSLPGTEGGGGGLRRRDMHCDGKVCNDELVRVAQLQFFCNSTYWYIQWLTLSSVGANILVDSCCLSVSTIAD